MQIGQHRSASFLFYIDGFWKTGDLLIVLQWIYKKASKLSFKLPGFFSGDLTVFVYFWSLIRNAECNVQIVSMYEENLKGSFILLFRKL